MRSVAKTITNILKDKCPDLTKKISAVYQTPKGILQPIYGHCNKQPFLLCKYPDQSSLDNIFHLSAVL